MNGLNPPKSPPLACEGGGGSTNGVEIPYKPPSSHKGSGSGQMVETRWLVFVGFSKWVGWRSPHPWPTSLEGRGMPCVEE